MPQLFSVRGAILGAGYGLATSAARSLLGIRIVQINRISPPVTPTLQGIGAEIALLAGLGLALSPLLKLRRGWLWHLLAMTTVWVGVEQALALDSPLFRGMAFGVPAGAGLLVLIGHAIARFRRWLPVTLGALLLIAGTMTPHVYLALTTPPKAPLGELPAARAGAPDVLLVVLDTVRAQNMSAYGYERETTPNFDALSRDAALFLEATSPSTWSLPSHASLFTGRFSSSHGAHFEHPFLDDTSPTLGEVLIDAGYDTLCFTANAFISDSIGLTRGFRYSDEAWRDGAGGRGFSFILRLLDRFGINVPDKGGAQVAENFERWIEERPSDGPPTFVFVNFLEAHFPYHQLPDDYLTLYTSKPRSELRAISEQLLGAQFGGSQPDPAEVSETAIAMYDGGVLYTDYLLGRLLDALRSKRKLDDTVVVVMADHGELIGEHGSYGHGPSLIEPGVHVPLLVRYPPRIPKGTRIARTVSTVGVFATVLDLVGLEPPPDLQVASLVGVIEGRPGGGPAISERHKAPLAGDTERRDPLVGTDQRFRSYREGNWKLIETSKGGRHLFDLGSDPSESINLAEASPGDLQRLRSELDDWRSLFALPSIDGVVEHDAVPDLDPAAEQRLRELGYIE